MKAITSSLFAASLICAPLAAQAETPMEMAQRLDACNGNQVNSARMTDKGLAVTCGSMSVSTQSAPDNGLLMPVIGLAGLAFVFGAMAGGSSASDTQ
ncbi:hypothetical protein [Rhodovulum adriaticum]|uniref:Secreted protein n=1 Tax=Rhodovulum adriaticum TaxID=35804 RepID=A0A4R2NYM8_RHOAD|nr:hypothetical protein [Rhodovulum adriaticum]MBK1634230.1 hypothetical protein [Rhodovulum adriaticum]TCP27217.1 hypothetical protein EV656_101120 [Rhodovulum adriaticum]